MYSALMSRCKFLPASLLHLQTLQSFKCNNQKLTGLADNLTYNRKFFATTSTMVQKIKVVKASAVKDSSASMGYNDRNIRRGRELSPHLTIYAPQLTSLMSISTRFSGVALTLLTWGWGLGYLTCSHDMEQYVTMLEGANFSSATLSILKFLLAFPVAYHVLNGTRHIAWGYGFLLSLRQIYLSGYLVLILTPLLSTWLALM